MADELQVFIDDPQGAVVQFGPVIYVVWRSHDSIKTIEVADQVVKSMVERYGTGRKLLYVQRAPREHGMVRTHADVRAAAMRHFEETDQHFLAAAVAIEADGFAGSIVRSVTAGVMLVRRAQVTTQVFNDAKDGVRWLAVLAKDHVPFDSDAMIKGLAARNLCT